MSIPNYLKINEQRIKNLPIQDLGTWNGNYDNKVFEKFEVVFDLRKKFPDKKINRADIIDLFRKDEKYLGFVAAMVWGFINASRPRIKGGDRTTTNFYRALSHEPQKVEDAIEFAENAFKKADYKSPFKEMIRGEKHNIPGIDYRYYTKIFFFLGQANEAIEKKPLIFDKWTANAFFALLSESQPDKVCKYFRDVKNAKNANIPGEAVVRSGNSLIEAYETFITLINEWSEILELSPDKLEEFIFGFDLMNGKRDSNPRVELWEIIDKNRNLVKCNQATPV